MTEQAELAAARARMVQQLAARGIDSPAVLAAMGKVPRERFVPGEQRQRAYDDSPLPIGCGQTISQPWMVARMVQELELTGRERVLEVGAGSGYGAAMLAELAAEVHTVERHPELARRATTLLAELGCERVTVVVGDGSQGWPDGAPYDAMVVTAAGPRIPPALLEQLKVGGRLVLPVGEDLDHQQLLRVERLGPEEYRQQVLAQVRFVPLVGEQGWTDPGT